jgi:hypothetical protein
MPRLIRAQGLMAVGLGLALVSCSLEDTKSDLNTEGNPRVITVTVLSESDGETATYCSTDPKEKLNPLYCPTSTDEPPVATVTNARPIGWQLRLIFNEHLQADAVEDLVPTLDINGNGQCDPADGDICYGTLVNTQPVTLTCAGESVPYDGYYDPSGNHLTDPGGPALVIEPIFPEAFVATGTQDCQVTVNSEVRGKDNNLVEQRGPYSFGIAALRIVSTSPAPPADGQPPAVVDPTASLEVRFNAYINLDSLAGTVTLEKIETDENGEIVATQVPINTSTSAAGNNVLIKARNIDNQDIDLDPGAEYKLTVTSGIEDIRGGVLIIDPREIPFTTAMPM